MSEFTHLIDLASARLGGEAVATNDDFFAEKENLVKAETPIFVTGKYTDRGKWMDGWESRRRRTPGHDWCIVKLGLPGIVHALSWTRRSSPELPSHAGRRLGMPEGADRRRFGHVAPGARAPRAGGDAKHVLIHSGMRRAAATSATQYFSRRWRRELRFMGEVVPTGRDIVIGPRHRLPPS